jgi:hypothetical protein
LWATGFVGRIGLCENVPRNCWRSGIYILTVTLCELHKEIISVWDSIEYGWCNKLARTEPIQKELTSAAVKLHRNSVILSLVIKFTLRIPCIILHELFAEYFTFQPRSSVRRRLPSHGKLHGPN